MRHRQLVQTLLKAQTVHTISIMIKILITTLVKHIRKMIMYQIHMHPLKPR